MRVIPIQTTTPWHSGKEQTETFTQPIVGQNNVFVIVRYLG